VSQQSLRHLSLFSGIGGIDIASHWAGFETVGFVERDPFCQRVLKHHFPTVPIFDDVCSFDGSEYENQIDLCTGGFPCQPFSSSGLRRGSRDERALFPQLCRILRQTKPEWFVGENVSGLLSSERGHYFGSIVNDLESMGYCVGWCCYNASDVGAIHRRKRVFIVAHNLSFRRQRTFGHEEGQQLNDRWNALGQHEGSRSRNGEGVFANSFVEQFDCCNIEQQTSNAQISKSRNSHCEAIAYFPIKSGNWRDWQIAPVVSLESELLRSNDGISDRLYERALVELKEKDKDRRARIKALGNAVVPHHIYPILKAIANQIRSEQ
jgi:DNA (cytosine-5)-methyltransferase 1